jgi:hypothetical protein
MRTSLFFSKNWPMTWLIFCLFQNGLFGQIAVELEKMNVMVAGFENPITVAASDVSDSCITLRSNAGKIKKTGNGKYVYYVAKDTTVITLLITDTCNNELLGKRTYRVKKLPVEILLGARHRSKTMGNGEFKAQAGIAALITGFDIDAKCDMVGYDAYFFSKKTGELWKGYNTGARFEGAVLEKVQAVKPGDWIIFRQFSYRCPGMKEPMFSDEELFFEIK